MSHHEPLALCETVCYISIRRRQRTARPELLFMSKPNGAILYEGPSALDGAPIVVIVTGLARKSTNAKTGALLQTWILRSDMHPIDAVRSGADSSICGDCRHRGCRPRPSRGWRSRARCSARSECGPRPSPSKTARSSVRPAPRPASVPAAPPAGPAAGPRLEPKPISSSRLTAPAKPRSTSWQHGWALNSDARPVPLPQDARKMNSAIRHWPIFFDAWRAS